MKIPRLMLVWFVLLLLAPGLLQAAPDAKCALAAKIARQAAESFEIDRKDGLRLFLKAHTLCPSNAEICANLGQAYYTYGNPKEALTYLDKALTAGCERPGVYNLAAWIMLEGDTAADRALEYATKACKLNPQAAWAHDTLIRAMLANNQLTRAVQQAHKSRKAWPKDARLAAHYDEAVDAFMACYLAKAKAGQTDKAIAGLRRIDFDPRIAKAACWVLFQAGQTDEALRAAREAGRKFSTDAELKQTFGAIMDRYIQARYRDFKAGQRADALMAVDGIRGRYPDHAALKSAYDKMFAAVLNEADTIDVPEPLKIASTARRHAQGEGLLADIMDGDASADPQDTDLQVDVDRNIPRGKHKNPHAVAVIIGNRNYSRGIPEVAYAARDAGYMKKYVVEVLGYDEDNIIYERNVTQGDLARIFGTRRSCKGKLHNYIRPGQSDVFVYYAGHGAPGPQGQTAYLMPVDADADYIAANGYALDTLYDNLAKLPARSLTVVLDACFSGDSHGGMLVKNVSPAVLKSASPVRQIANGVIFTSAAQDQVSCWYPDKRHSLFTYFFLKGLGGAADRDKNRRITVAEMKTYLDDKVAYRARRLAGREQTPLVMGDTTRELARLR